MQGAQNQPGLVQRAHPRVDVRGRKGHLELGRFPSLRGELGQVAGHDLAGGQKEMPQLWRHKRLPVFVRLRISRGRIGEQPRPRGRLVAQVENLRATHGAVGQHRRDAADQDPLFVERLDAQVDHDSDFSIVASN